MGLLQVVGQTNLAERVAARRVDSVHQGLKADAALELLVNLVRVVVHMVQTCFVRLAAALTDAVVVREKREAETRHIAFASGESASARKAVLRNRRSRCPIVRCFSVLKRLQVDSGEGDIIVHHLYPPNNKPWDTHQPTDSHERARSH